ncbi:hypothetical protein Chor_010740 [Crotalus horridus]
MSINNYLCKEVFLIGTGPPARTQEVQAENVTVAEGGQAEINCKLHQYDGSIVVIQNPSRQTLFFNGTRGNLVSSLQGVELWAGDGITEPQRAQHLEGGSSTFLLSLRVDLQRCPGLETRSVQNRDSLKDERFQLVEFTQKQVRIVLSNARLEDEGGYYCQLYTEDTHHQIAILTVLVPPDSPLVEVKEQAVEGGEVELTCSIPRSRPAATLRWYRDRKEIKGTSSKQENGKVFSITSMVRFWVDRKDHSSIVTCEAIHPALRGQRKQTQYVLDVQYSPTARIHPPQGVMREGDTLVLTCAVNGNPLPRDIKWSRANDTLPERALIEGEVLTIPNLSMLDNGTYSCHVANKHGRSSDQYVLVVYGSYLTHEASGLDEHGEAREAFLNGGDGHKRKEEFFI